MSGTQAVVAEKVAKAESIVKPILKAVFKPILRLLAIVFDTYRLCTVLGIPMKIDGIVVAMVAYIALSSGSLHAGLAVVALFAAVYSSVIVHELGHAMAARGCGVRTRDIVIWPLGGMARLDSIPRVGWQELLIAFSGPAVSFILAAAFLALSNASPGGNLSEVSYWIGRLNLLVGIFNLLPCFPLDGGRILRATLSFLMDYRRASRYACWVATLGAAGMAAYGWTHADPMMGVVALFVVFGSWGEYRELAKDLDAEAEMAKETPDQKMDRKLDRVAQAGFLMRRTWRRIYDDGYKSYDEDGYPTYSSATASGDPEANEALRDMVAVMEDLDRAVRDKDAAEFLTSVSRAVILARRLDRDGSLGFAAKQCGRALVDLDPRLAPTFADTDIGFRSSDLLAARKVLDEINSIKA